MENNYVFVATVLSSIVLIGIFIILLIHFYEKKKNIQENVAIKKLKKDFFYKYNRNLNNNDLNLAYEQTKSTDFFILINWLLSNYNMVLDYQLENSNNNHLSSDISSIYNDFKNIEYFLDSRNKNDDNNVDTMESDINENDDKIVSSSYDDYNRKSYKDDDYRSSSYDDYNKKSYKDDDNDYRSSSYDRDSSNDNYDSGNDSSND